MKKIAFLNMFKFTNKWQQKSLIQGDRIDLGIVGDWSDRDISARLRVGICYLFAFGLTWSVEEYQAYVCVLNFQIGVKYKRTDNENL